MALPYLHAYNDSKRQKAYERYLAGQSQRKIAAALKIPPRTVAHWSKTDGWEEERKARKIAAESPHVAAVAAGESAPLQGAATQHASSTVVPTVGEPETRLAGMERMLARQQRLAGRLMGAMELDIEKTFAEAETSGRPIQRSQIAQLKTLLGDLAAIERKAWCVPDKIETKDTTPTPADEVRKLTDDQLDRELEELERAASAAASREAPPASVN